MRILDLGCGPGCDLTSWGVTAADEVTGVDIDESRLQEARRRYPDRTFFRAAGESLPFQAAAFDRVISAVALPYMDIPKALDEVRRVLRAKGKIGMSLHPPAFTWKELTHYAIPRPKATLFRLYVMTNGMCFHVSGRTLHVFGKSESCQTERGIKIALQRAGFGNVHFHSVPGPVGSEFRVEAEKVT